MTTIVAAVGSALVGGVFFAFSTFVMPALRRLPLPDGAAAMQAINIAVITPLFMIAFFGTALACLVVGVASLSDMDSTSGPLGLTGAIVYLLGVLLLTGTYHVPRNNRLERLSGAEASGYWPSYEREWTRANHVRTVAGIVAAVLLTTAAAAS